MMVILTNILYWRIAAIRKASTAMKLLNMSFCNGLRMPNFARNGNRMRSNDKVNKSANTGWIVCIWSGLISQPMSFTLPSINVACSVHREPCQLWKTCIRIVIRRRAHNIFMYKNYSGRERERDLQAHLLFEKRPKYRISDEYVQHFQRRLRVGYFYFWVLVVSDI